MLLMWRDMQVSYGPVQARQPWVRKNGAPTAAAAGGEAVLGTSAGLHHADNAVYRSAWLQVNLGIILIEMMQVFA